MNFGYELAARLLEPGAGFPWLLRATNVGGTFLFKANADTQNGFFNSTFYRTVAPTGFPYGEVVDQTSLLPT